MPTCSWSEWISYCGTISIAMHRGEPIADLWSEFKRILKNEVSAMEPFQSQRGKTFVALHEYLHRAREDKSVPSWMAHLRFIVEEALRATIDYDHKVEFRVQDDAI